MKTKEVSVRVTPEDWDEINSAAKSEGMSLATFVRVAALRMARWPGRGQ